MGAKFRSLKLNKELLTIDNDAFAFSENLTEINIPKSVEAIGKGVFRGCRNLQVINVEEGCKAYNSIDGVLYDNTKRKKLKAYPEAKGEKYKLIEGCKIIECSAFENNSTLTTVTLNKELEEIGDFAFRQCLKIKQICASMQLPVTGENMGDMVFANVAIDKVTLVVPKDCKAKYMQASIWRDFGNIIESSNVSIKDVNNMPLSLKCFISDNKLYLTNCIPNTRYMIYNADGTLIKKIDSDDEGKAMIGISSKISNQILLITGNGQSIKVIVN